MKFLLDWIVILTPLQVNVSLQIHTNHVIAYPTQSYTVGPLCQWVETDSAVYTRESCNTLEAYINTLMTTGSCEFTQPGRLVWTPNEDTPDIVYYQVH